MKKITNLTLSVFALLLAIAGVNAQTPYNTTGNSPANAGTVNFSVTVPKAADLRTDGGATADNGASVTTASASNDALLVNLNFSDASPNQANVTSVSPFMTATVPVRMRSNASYQVLAFRNGTLNATGAGDFKASDVGIGLINVTRTGTGLNAAGTDTPNGFQNDPASATVTNGQPAYSKTLADIGTATSGDLLLSGDRISNGGDNTSTNNFNTAQIKLAVKPQYYTPGTYTETLKVYIVTP